MAGKEDSVRNLGAVGGGSAPAEKEAAPEGVRVGSVPSAHMPRPLPAGRHKRGEKEANLVYGGLRPCSGIHTPTADMEQLQADADSVSGGSLRARSARRALGEKQMVKEALTGEKRKAEEGSEASAGLGCAELGGEGAAAADVTVVPAVGESFVDEATGIKYVDMPERYLCWVLSQKKLSPSPYDPREYPRISQQEIEQQLASMKRLDELLEGVEEEFFEFQAWVRETYKTKGRVLVPEDSIPEAFTSAE